MNKINDDVPERDPNPPERDVIVCMVCDSQNIDECFDTREDYVCLDCGHKFDECEWDYGFDTLEERDM